MFVQKGQHAIFHVHCPEADEAYLMVGAQASSTRTVKMQRNGDDLWEARLKLAPGRYRYRFYTRINGSLVYQPPKADAAFWVDGWDAHCEVRPDTAEPAIATATAPAPFGDHAPIADEQPPPKHLPPWAARVLSF